MGVHTRGNKICCTPKDKDKDKMRQEESNEYQAMKGVEETNYVEPQNCD